VHPIEITDWYDFLKENGCDNIIDYDDWIMCACPFHKQSDSSRPSFGIYKDTGWGNCFGCGGHSWVDICEVFGISPEDFIECVKEKVWDKFVSRLNTKQVVKYQRFNLPDGCYEYNISNVNLVREYFEKRNFDIDFISRMNIEYCIDNLSKYSGCIIFPIYDEKGLLYFQGRYLGDCSWKPRWSQPKGCAKWKTYWGWETFKNNKTVFFVEGISDGLKLLQFGLPVISAKNFSPYQIKSIIKSPIENILLLYDNDEAGRYAKDKRGNPIHFNAKAEYLFSDSGRTIKVVDLPDVYKDPAELKHSNELFKCNSWLKSYADSFY